MPVVKLLLRRRADETQKRYTFLSHGWCNLVRRSSSHLTTPSSSFDCSPVPRFPVGLPEIAQTPDAISKI